jgi:uncharacterized protein
VADGISFDWDEANLKHIARHNVSRVEAEQVFLNGFVEFDYQVVDGEERELVIGLTNAGRFLTLLWTEHDGAVRPITAWDATREEEEHYWIVKGA